MGGWMSSFTSFSSVFQLYQEDEWVIVKASVIKKLNESYLQKG